MRQFVKGQAVKITAEHQEALKRQGWQQDSDSWTFTFAGYVRGGKWVYIEHIDSLGKLSRMVPAFAIEKNKKSA